jgi:hypothetical protein
MYLLLRVAHSYDARTWRRGTCRCAHTFVMGCRKCTPDEFAASCRGREARSRAYKMTDTPRGCGFYEKVAGWEDLAVVHVEERRAVHWQLPRLLDVHDLGFGRGYAATLR